MSNVTLEGIAALLKEELKPFNDRLEKVETRLGEIEKTLAVHTAALEKLLTEKKTRDENTMVKDSRLEYLEHWAKQVSQKLGVEFRP